MDRLLEPLAPNMRLGVSTSFALLGFVCGWFALSRLATGPWILVGMVTLVAACAIHLSFSAWPSKPPRPVAEFLDKWSKVKGRSAKSVAGSFVWNLGRSAIAAILASQVLGMVSDIAGFLFVAMVAGFAVSTGFFGIQSAVWSGLVIFLVGHRLAMIGLNVDFADPGSRQALASGWASGGAMSWWWPIGLGVGAPLWIALAAISSKVRVQIAEELAERRNAAIAKKKIDARRNRLRGRQEQGGVDHLAAARKEREDAQARIEASARGHNGAGSEGGRRAGDEGAAQGSTELNGVAKLEHDSNEDILKRYIEHVQSIQQSKRSGIDVDTAARRSFDRVLQSMNDKQLALLRSGALPGWQDLDAYYNELCGVEAAATSGGDGEVVTSFPVQGDVLDQDDGFQPETLGSLPSSEIGVGNNEDDDAGVLSVDLLDAPAEALPPAPIGRRAALADDIEMMLSEPKASSLREGPDGTPEGVAALPLANGPKTLIDSVEVFGGAETIETEALEVAAEGSEAGSNTADAARDIDDPEIETPAESEASADPEHDESRESVEGGVGSNGVAEDEEKEVVAVADQERRNAAGLILAGQFDREFVLRTLDYFPTLEDACGAIGLPEQLFEEKYERYRAQVAGARHELGLATLLEGEDAEAVRLSLAAVKAANWEAEPDLVVQAETWLQRKDDEARERAEAEARLEEQRAEEVETARRAAEEEARAAEERRKAEVEAAAEAEREREREAAKAARLEELNANRKQFAVYLLVGAYGDDLLDAGEDLFPTVEALAEVLGLETSMVQPQFDDFTAKRLAKSKLTELKQAWEAHDLFQVQSLIQDRTGFENYPGYEEILEGATVWARGEEAKQRVLGLKDKVVEDQQAAGEMARKKFMRRRLQTTDEQIDLIETKLPAALTIAQSLERAIVMMGDAANPVMVAEHKKAVSEAARAAALIVEHEKTCREYAMAFFPRDQRSADLDVWGMIVELAEKGEAVATVDETGTSSLTEEKGARLANAPVKMAKLDLEPKRMSLEEIQAIDPAPYFGDVKFEPLKDREVYERMYRLSCLSMLADDEPEEEFLESSPVCYSLYFGQRDGVELGRLAIHTTLKQVPIWYREATDEILWVYTEDGNRLVTKESREFVNWINLYFQSEQEPRDQVRGVIVMSPYISEDGIRSFAPLLAKMQKGPVRIHNDSLSEVQISAFVEQIKGA